MLVDEVIPSNDVSAIGHLLIRTDCVRSGSCLWKNYTITYKRLETPISSALAAEVTAILDIQSELA